MLTQRLNDTNNNNKCLRDDKYSLRPRSLIRSKVYNKHIKFDENDTTIRNEHLNKLKTTKQINIINTTNNNNISKNKAAPLSKYRRKTANARERSRMREINYAFEALRRAVPHIFVLQCPPLGGSTNVYSNNNTTTTCEKLTKITTLRLAMRYISALTSVLNNNNNNNDDDVMTSSSASSTTSTKHQSYLMESSDEQIEIDEDLSLCSSSHSTFDIMYDQSTAMLNEETIYNDALLSSDCSATLLSNNISNTTTTSLDFMDQSLSPPDFSEHSSLSAFDEFIPHFS